MPTQPQWLNKQLFPFESKWINVDGHSQHYIDEGSGDQTILFVHGTPEWSFGFRDLVKSPRQNFRCVAIDHLGFGLSDKPENANYTVEAHSKRLTKFIEKLELQDITIVANDFGGGISLGYAVTHSSNVKRVVLFNTWMWSLREDKNFSGPAGVVNTWFGRFLYKKLNMPVNVIMPAAYGDKKKLTPEVHQHYKEVVPDSASRVALYAIALELMNASPWWDSMWSRMNQIESKPFLIFWGMKDNFVKPYMLDKWKQRLPKVKVIEYEDAGHFTQEEKPVEMSTEIERFMKS
jgi:pimeloyl-ACP methyl ester carboxylesterase